MHLIFINNRTKATEILHKIKSYAYLNNASHNKKHKNCIAKYREGHDKEKNKVKPHLEH